MESWIQNNVFLSVIVIPVGLSIIVGYSLYRFGLIQRASKKYDEALEKRQRKTIEKELRKSERSDAEIRTVIGAVTHPAEFNSHLIIETQTSTIDFIFSAVLILIAMSIVTVYSILAAFSESELRELSTSDTLLMIITTSVMVLLAYVVGAMGALKRRKLRRETYLAHLLRLAIQVGFDLEIAAYDDVRHILDRAKEIMNARDASELEAIVSQDEDR